MYQLTYQIIVLCLIIFSSPKLVDLIFQEQATFLELFLISFLWFYSFVVIRPRLNSREKKIPDFFLGIMLCCTLLVASISILVREIPVHVVIYRSFSYLSFYPLVYLFGYIKRKYKILKKVLIVYIILCSVISVGIVCDSIGGLTSIPIVGEQIINLEKESGTYKHRLRGGQRRGSFFLGGSTGVFPFLSLTILCTIILYRLETNNKKYIINSIPSVAFLWIGCFFSLSRAPLLLATMLGSYVYFRIFLISETRKIQRTIAFGTLALILVLAIPTIQSNLYKQINFKVVKILQSGASSKDRANSSRYYSWYEGSLLFKDLDSWIGYGLGTSNLAVKKNRLLEYNQYRDHYESSLLSTFSEGGVIGLIVFLTPFLIIIWKSKNNPDRDLYIVWSVMLMLNFFAAPIYGYSSQLAYFTGMSFCLVLKPSKMQIVVIPNNDFMEEESDRLLPSHE